MKSRSGLWKRLQALQEGSGSLEGYYDYLRAQDAYIFRHERLEAIRLRDAGEAVPGYLDFVLSDRYSEHPATASLADGSPMPEFGSPQFPATAAQLRKHRATQAWFKTWSAGEGARHMAAIRERVKATSEPKGRPETPEPNSGEPGKPTAIFEHPAPPLNVTDYRKEREKRGLPEHPGSASTYETLPQVRQPGEESKDAWFKTGRDDSPIAGHLPEVGE